MFAYCLRCAADLGALGIAINIKVSHIDSCESQVSDLLGLKSWSTDTAQTEQGSEISLAKGVCSLAKEYVYLAGERRIAVHTEDHAFIPILVKADVLTALTLKFGILL